MVGVPVALGVGGGVGHVLIEGASGEEGHELHAQTDAQDWLVGVVVAEVGEEVDLEGLAGGVEAGCL